MSETSTSSAPPSPPAGPVVWWEIQVPDLDKAQAFYGAVFGWSFAAFGDGFVIASTPDGAMVGGLDASSGAGDPAGRHVRVYFGVDDLEATMRRVEAAGGDVVQGRTLVSEDYGWFATIADPSGVRLGLLTDKAADPRA